MRKKQGTNDDECRASCQADIRSAEVHESADASVVVNHRLCLVTPDILQYLADIIVLSLQSYSQTRRIGAVFFHLQLKGSACVARYYGWRTNTLCGVPLPYALIPD